MAALAFAASATFVRAALSAFKISSRFSLINCVAAFPIKIKKISLYMRIHIKASLLCIGSCHIKKICGYITCVIINRKTPSLERRYCITFSSKMQEFFANLTFDGTFSPCFTAIGHGRSKNVGKKQKTTLTFPVIHATLNTERLRSTVFLYEEKRPCQNAYI